MRIALAVLAFLVSSPAFSRLWVLRSADDLTIGTVPPIEKKVPDPDAIRYWSAGAPNYRWNEIAFELYTGNSAGVVAERMTAALHIAINDAVVVASARKVSMHAAAAGAAETVLAHLFPDKAADIAQRADVAVRTRVDDRNVATGLAIGRAAGAKVVERLRNDGSDKPWDGSVPSTEGTWNGTNPVLPQIATWKPWILKSPDAIRPPAPPKFDDDAMKEVTDPKNLTGARKVAAFKWVITGLLRYFNEQASVRIFEEKLDRDPVRSAEIYAVLNAAYYDALVVVWDAKFAYWGQRPNQFDATFKSQITTPNFPGYPSGHAIFGATAAAILGHYFPRDAKKLDAIAEDIANSRLWAGVHFRVDNEVGAQMGRTVAAAALARR
jgi:PAP2 superfamily